MQYAIPLSKKSDTPLSQQLYLWLRNATLTGVLSPGERLPSTRELSEQLCVSRTVVLVAYDQLLAEGFVVGRHGSGTFVSDALGVKNQRTRTRAANLRLSRFGTSAAAAAETVDFPKRRESLRYDFSYRSSPVEGFPLATWQRILGRRARRASVRMHGYSAATGHPALREAIAQHLR